MKKYFAEFVGTVIFTFVVTLSLVGKFPVSTPVVAALTLGLLVYLIGHLSGAHLNPAVTIGLWSIKKISAKDTGGYLAAQFLGAGFSYYVSRSLVVATTLTVSNSWVVLIAELLGAVVFMFGIAAVVSGRVPTDISGIAVGSSLFLGLVIAVTLGSNAALNPAMALAIGSFSWGYALAPIVGSVVGMNLYKWLSETKN